MQTRNPLFDDLSRLMTSAAGTFQGAGATRTSLRINAVATLLVQIPLSVGVQ